MAFRWGEYCHVECARRAQAHFAITFFVEGKSGHAQCPPQGTIRIENVKICDRACNAVHML